MAEKRQKRIALINDMTGFGRCSIAVGLPLISALKVQACPLPTAVLSAHTGFPKHYMNDYTQHMRPYMKNWQELGIEFDGICTGFLGSAEQISIVIEFLEIFKTEKTMILLDPVMGDHGKIYSSYTTEMCKGMSRLLAYADLATPNLTETCELLDRPYPEDGVVSDDELLAMAKELCAKGPGQIVITGLSRGKELHNFIYEKDQGSHLVCVPKIGGDRSGTGDAFSAIVGASLVKGEDLTASVQKAAEFISKSLAYTVSLDLPWNYGICFEEFLTELK